MSNSSLIIIFFMHLVLPVYVFIVPACKGRSKIEASVGLRTRHPWHTYHIPNVWSILFIHFFNTYTDPFSWDLLACRLVRGRVDRLCPVDSVWAFFLTRGVCCAYQKLYPWLNRISKIVVRWEVYGFIDVSVRRWGADSAKMEMEIANSPG